MHEPPAVQAWQLPALHTLFVPQTAPFVSSCVVSVHALPLVQLSVPMWQTLVGVHAAPSEHDTQVPVVHTWLAPHDVPSVSGDPPSTQTT